MNGTRQRAAAELFRPGRRLREQCLLVAAIAFAVGCSSGESPAPRKPLSSDSKAVSAAPELQPQETEPDDTAGSTPEQAEAEAAFRTMTAENPDPTAWRAADQKLQEIGAAALPVLLDGLKSDSQLTRETASSVLAQFGAEAEPVADDLIVALDDESAFVRANVATALLQMSEHVERVVPVFVQLLSGEDSELRLTAAANLATMEPEAVSPFVPQLVAELKGADRDVALPLTQLLGRIGPDASAALPALKSLPTDDDAELQAAVETAISQIDPDGGPE